ncbi:MAG: 16S rRNA (guanine(527)-N(7))-methyltransferase RsmG [Cytophagales bacterium]|nr:MAG: 16S rRNA (guanine(527)-N(7))-methyltransferase RsmG [Cytophagales bacterium]
MNLLQKYFPEIETPTLEKFQQLEAIYREWNAKINLISRKDIDFLYEKHFLHSLAIAKIIAFQPMARVLDLGTGGGFPGIPLALFFPKTEFVLADSIGKKIQVVQNIIDALEINNAKAINSRAEKIDEQYDFIVSRAVAPAYELMKWTQGKFLKMYNHSLKNGIICLKGGDLQEEIQGIKKTTKVWDIQTFFEEDFFTTKKILYIQMI